MPSVLPPAVPERTPAQWGGRPKTSHHDPAQLVAKFHSMGWKKDLEHVLRVYYKYNTASYKEAEWAKLKDKFFTRFLPHKEEALGIKERCPMDYMVCIKEHFQRATGLCLNGLQDFTAWIKQGSYYYGLVAQQGYLHRCPHLVGVPLPRWPQVTHSESHWESQKKADTQTTSSSEPNTGAMAAPVMEAPVVETPVMEIPVAQNPVSLMPELWQLLLQRLLLRRLLLRRFLLLRILSRRLLSLRLLLMETGGVGDGQSWAEHVKAGVEEEFQQDRPVKHCRSQSKKREQRPMLPFPLQDSEGRLASISQLYKHAGEQPAACHNAAGRGIMHLHSEVLPGKVTCLGNQVVCMIAEYHLTTSAQGPSSLSLILPVEAAALLPPIKNHVPSFTLKGTRDVRVMDRARTLRVAVWLHQLDMAITGDRMASETLEAS